MKMALLCMFHQMISTRNDKNQSRFIRNGFRTNIQKEVSFEQAWSKSLELKRCKMMDGYWAVFKVCIKRLQDNYMPIWLHLVTYFEQ